MGLCATETKRRRPFKTIIIPKGIINPNENNVIEIPMKFDTTDSLIVKPPNDQNTCFSVEPYPGISTNLPPVSYPVTDTCVNFSGNTVNVTDGRLQETPIIYPITTEDNVTKIDFGCQTSPPEEAFQSVGVQQPPFLSTNVQHNPEEAHSPLCPICAKVSCKYSINTGINRPYNHNRGYFSNPSFKDPFPYFSTQPRDNDMIYKIIEERVERILRPVLLSLANLSPDEEETESFMGSSSYTPKYSSSSIPSKGSRDQFYFGTAPYGYPFNEDISYRAKHYGNSSSRNHCYRDSDYKGYRGECRRTENVPYTSEEYYRFDVLSPTTESTRTDTLNTYDDFVYNFDKSKRRSSAIPDRETSSTDQQCPMISSCQRNSSCKDNESSSKSIKDIRNTTFCISPERGSSQRRTSVSFEDNYRKRDELKLDKSRSLKRGDDVLNLTSDDEHGSSSSKRTTFKK